MSRYHYKLISRWSYEYRYSMMHGLEYCRMCKSTEDLTFDHLLPRCYGGRNTIDNITILCRSCNNEKGMQYFGWLESLIATPPEGWSFRPVSEIKLDDFTIAGRVASMKTWVKTKHLEMRFVDPPFPKRVRGIDTSNVSLVGVFTAKELAYA